MKRFIEGDDREQGLLFPDHLCDFVHEDNPVRDVMSSGWITRWQCRCN